MIKTLSILAIASSILFPFESKAASGCTTASYYGTPGDGFGYRSGQMTTSSGERFYPGKFTTAHRSLPFGTRLRVTNQSNGRSVVVRVTDRGPFIASRDLDLSYGAFATIASPSNGVARVCYSVI